MVLEELAGQNGSYELFIHDYSAEGVFLEGIPSGTYLFSFETIERFFSFPAPGEPGIEIHLGGTPKEVVIPIGTFGGIELVQEDASAPSYDGEIQLVITKIGEKVNKTALHRLRHPPYVVWGLPEGLYRLGFSGKPHPVVFETDTTEVYLAAGETQRVPIRPNP
ncbi:MAG: hypothetical protein ACE5H3_04830 [Planctomycetota bacterium]